MNAFHVCGALLALWALLVSFLGITRDGFPGSRGGARIVGAISIVLVLLAIGSAIYTGANESEHEEGTRDAALVPPG